MIRVAERGEEIEEKNKPAVCRVGSVKGRRPCRSIEWRFSIGLCRVAILCVSQFCWLRMIPARATATANAPKGQIGVRVGAEKGPKKQVGQLQSFVIQPQCRIVLLLTSADHGTTSFTTSSTTTTTNRFLYNYGAGLIFCTSMDCW